MESRRLIEAKILELNREEARRPRAPLPIGGLDGTVVPPGNVVNNVGNVLGVLPPANLPRVWEEIPGYYAMTKFEFRAPGTGVPVFTPSSGIAVKAFINNRTGEIRTFSATSFEE